MELLYALQGVRSPFWDAIVQTITFLGEETVFLVVSIVLLWCVDKKWGYRFFIIGMFGNVINQFLKAIFVTPRPWVRDPDFPIVESAREAATGYSFPSGHTTGAGTLFGSIAIWLRRRYITVVCILLALAVGFSRLYLGVHMPEDVLVGLLTALLVVLVMDRLLKKAETNKRVTYAIGLTALGLALLLLLYVSFAPKGAGHMPEFDEHGVEAAWCMFGTTLGMCLGWWIDDRYLRYEIKAVWWAQILKAVIGIGIVLVIRIFLKAPLNAVFGPGLGKGVRYFLMVMTASVFWPMTFKWFATLGKPKK